MVSFLYADTEDSDQTGQLAKVAPSFCWPHTQYCFWFCYGVAQLVMNECLVYFCMYAICG